MPLGIKGFVKGYAPWNKNKKLPYIIWNKGKQLSLETRNKMSNTRKGNPVLSKNLINGGWNKGLHLSEETKQKISKSLKGKVAWNKGLKGYMAGEKNPKWKGGISKDKNYDRLCKIKRRDKKYGTLTIKTIQQVYEDNIKKYGTLTCYLCLQSIPFGQDCIEHKIPLSRGGTNSRDNLDIAHRGCNNRKYNKTEEEFRKEQIDEC